MAIITLTTDWNRSDYYVGAVKGRLLSLLPKATVIDISHQIQSYNFAQAAFVVKACFEYYPEGTIHIIDVASDGSEKTPHSVIKAKGQYFIGADNGMFSLLFDGGIEEAINVKIKDELLTSFQGLSIFVPVAVALAKGTQMKNIGEAKNTFARAVPILPIVEQNYISGHILYVDSYFNAISNITKEQFEETRAGRNFLIHVQSKQNEISHISRNYNSDANGDLIALFNSMGLLEISIIKGYAAELLNLDPSSTLRITFIDN